jgi:fimbrial isopeptide formation D2 family protein/LPXTG-motif cell wall-anchored protein
MSKLKRMLSLALATAMTLCSGVFTTMAEADDSYKICIKNATDGHSYVAYQILTGTVDGETLTNIEWGSATVGHEADDKADDFAEALTENKNDTDRVLELVDEQLSTQATGTKSGSYDADNEEYEISVPATGYYLVKEETATGIDAYSAYILAVVGADTDVEVKSGVPTVEKKVKDVNDTTGATTDWQDTADYDIDDTVPFQLTATLGENVDYYNAYALTFTDTLSAGLTYVGPVRVTFEGKDVSKYFSAEVKVLDDLKTSIKVYCKDVKAFGATDESQIVVNYDAKLNELANTGATGNPNEVYLTYSNNPSNTYEGFGDDGTDDLTEPEDGEEPKGSGDIPEETSDTDDTTGKTPTDVVVVYTYEVTVNKLQPDGDSTKELKGAKFALYKQYNDTNVTGADENGWVLVDEYSEGTADISKFAFIGLDDGYYKIVELEAPSGFNKASDIFFTITAEHDVLSDTPKLNSVTINCEDTDVNFEEEENETGIYSVDVINYTGAVLPTTGGMGTKAIYVIGGLMVLAAGVLLITKRRMGNE